MQNDPAREWLRLTSLYREMSDEELQDLGAGYSDLTELAQPILRDELKRRGLPDPAMTRPVSPQPLSQPAPMLEFEERMPVFGGWSQRLSGQNGELNDEESDTGEADLPHEYTWKTELCRCGGSEEAWQFQEVLRLAGIESWIESPQGELDLTGPRVLVAADQLDEARAILARPIPQDIIDQSKVKDEGFVAPRCPKCGASDPLLESVEPTNTWLCEDCGARWTEASVSTEGAAKASS